MTIRFAFLIMPVLILSACAGGTAKMDEADRRMQQINSALERSANQVSERKEITDQDLAKLERSYKRAPQNPQNAVRYARALREIGEFPRALIVLEPFTKTPDAEAGSESAPGFMRTEFISILLETGRYAQAEQHARDAVLANPDDGLPYHLLGITLDAQGFHKQAETSFRRALDRWSGDPVPVMNNLALSLTSQGYLDEAADILRKAKAADPNRMAIERNLRIVEALLEVEYSIPEQGRAEDGHKQPKQAPLPVSKPLI